VIVIVIRLFLKVLEFIISFCRFLNTYLKVTRVYIFLFDPGAKILPNNMFEKEMIERG